MGAADKNTMFSTVSWLLALSAGGIGYVVTQRVASTWPWLERPGPVIVIASLGIMLSLVAAYVTLLYGGYANQNWDPANAIAPQTSLG